MMRALFSILLAAGILPVMAAHAGDSEPASAESVLGQYAGDFWEDEEAFAAEIQVIEGRLWAVHSPTRRNELVPVGPDRFRMLGVPGDVIVHFDRDANGITGMRRTIDGEPRGSFRPFERRRPTAAELAGYTGTYHGGDPAQTYVLESSSGTLRFRVAGQPDEALTPMFGETFEHPDLGAFTFQRDRDGRVASFVLQRRGADSLTFDRQ